VLFAAACSREPDAAGRARPAAPAPSSSATVLATLPDVSPPRTTAAPVVLGLHAPIAVANETEILFPERGGAVTIVVHEEDGSRVVHGGREGKRYAAIGQVVVSPDGSRFAHGALAGGRWHMVVDGVEREGFDAVKDPAFSPDGEHVAYQAMDGDLWRLVVDRTASPGTRTRYLAHRFSGDSSRIAFIDDAGGEEKGRLVVSDLAFETPTVVAAAVARFVVDAAGARIAAVSATGGGQRVLTLGFDAPERVTSGPAYDAVSGIVLGPDGSLAHVAERSGKRFMVLNGKEEPFPAGELRGVPVVRPGGPSIAALVQVAGRVRLQRFFAAGGGEGAWYDDAEDLVFSADGRSLAFAARRGPSWSVVVDGNEGPPFDRVVTPLFGPDGKVVVYRARKDGRRFVVVANADGTTKARHPAFDQVFPARYASDGRSIAYGVVEGRQVLWKVEAP